VGQETAGPSAAPNKPFPARGFGLGVIDHPDPGAAAGSARSPGWPPTSATFAPAGAVKAATASAVETMLATLARTMRLRLRVGLRRTRLAALATSPIPHKSLRMVYPQWWLTV
jgi:hypothetical protein